MSKVASVYLPVPLEQSFFYLVEDDVPLYARVEVKLRGKSYIGVVGELHQREDIQVAYEIRPVERVLDERPIVTEQIWKLANWMSGYYVSPLGEVLGTMLPKAKRPTPLLHEPGKRRELFPLNAEQKLAYEKMVPHLGTSKWFLLHGVTGSGKTEIYKHLVARSLEQGMSVLILLPEISLTPQMVERFSQVFGEVIALYHSRLSSGERFYEWLRCLSGEARVAIGPRSAVFLPMRNLGLIIVDEEHEPSYKSQESPRYHARQIAMQRSRQENTMLILGSATPQLETYYYAQQGMFELVTLKERYGKAPLPHVHIVDLKQTKETEKNTILSASLLQAMLDVLSRKRQVLLFLNRRGHAPVLLCTDCGQSIICPHCDITLTFHKKKHRLICHHCGYEMNPPDRCPSCNGFNLKEIGVGTERLESFLTEYFSGYRTVRLDMDTTSQKHSFDLLLHKIREHQYDIIVGTQMMAKGHDIEKLDLVGVILADIGLQIPDFRASERSFVLITQVVGRAGRRDVPGEAYIQTYLPDHPAIVYGAKQDYESFFAQEIQKRKEFLYPPFVRLGRVVIRSTDLQRLKEFLSDIQSACTEFKKLHGKEAMILGPLPCPIEKLKNAYRYHIIIKSQKAEKIQAFFRLMKEELKRRRKSSLLYLELDLDPIHML
ncbi:replication restart helicase PriA [Thermospira aquatica]|uniref:Probable replication restart protein PriA n=1 Tax=Thermospira aquatica TaxID=2828656 RepID=A0AAX3BED9_9SPIR|nr:primosomal protein N' [Thermospira aquatica]URA10419.1 primosomal protein N' [Thermospira aquatica]